MGFEWFTGNGGRALVARTFSLLEVSHLARQEIPTWLGNNKADQTISESLLIRNYSKTVVKKKYAP